MSAQQRVPVFGVAPATMYISMYLLTLKQQCCSSPEELDIHPALQAEEETRVVGTGSGVLLPELVELFL
jgi:hypothetical protein